MSLKSRFVQQVPIKTVVVLVLAMPLLGSAAELKKVKLHNNVKRMKVEVLKRIPIGSSIEHAKAVMEKSGFKCEMAWEDGFAEIDEQGKQISDRDGLDFLYCDRGKTVFPWICTRRWQIAIVHEDGVVKEVLVSIGETCP